MFIGQNVLMQVSEVEASTILGEKKNEHGLWPSKDITSISEPITSTFRVPYPTLPCKTTRQNPEDHKPNFHHYKNLKSHIIIIMMMMVVVVVVVVVMIHVSFLLQIWSV
jgi:hypothetical protein